MFVAKCKSIAVLAKIGGNMLLVSRIWVSIIGLLSILTVLPHWFRLEGLVDERGVQALGVVGRANVRADMGGMFLAIGILALIASYKRSTSWLLATIVVPASALLGRFVSIGLDGSEQRVMEPIIVEVAVLALLATAYRLWRKEPEGL
jgi:hypothetical protein